MVCPSCKNEVSLTTNAYYCKECDTTYPFFSGSIPILHPEPSNYIVKQLLKFWKYIETTNEELKQFEKTFDASIRPLETKGKISEALKINLDHFEAIQAEMASLVSMHDIRVYLSLPTQEDNLSYTFNYEYLRRDWTWEVEGEHEIQQIKKSLKKLLSNINRSGPVLFIGAGLARMACEISNQFSEVYAIDNEVTMAYFFDKVRREDFDLYEINLRNAKTNDDLFMRLKASSKPIDQQVKKRITYVIGNAAQLPFTDNYFDAVISIYFTDVLPLQGLLKETKRVLCVGGSFVHFGPLEYHFKSISSMISLQEVRTVLRKFGFAIFHEDQLKLQHCKSNLSGSHKIYTNWIIGSVKNPLTPIDDYSIISRIQNLEYTETGTIGHHYNNETTTIRVNGGEPVKISEQVIDILKAVGNQCSIDQLISRLENDFNYENIDKQMILEVIRTLEKEGIIIIEPRQNEK